MAALDWGLAITKRLVELLGGDISCQSDLGTGSVFSIRLPVDACPLIEDEPDTENSLDAVTCGDVTPRDATLENSGSVEC